MSTSNIATKSEAEFLKGNRRPPDPELTLTPGGGVQFQVDYDMHRMRERRIAFIENRLKMASAGMNRARSKAISHEQ